MILVYYTSVSEMHLYIVHRLGNKGKCLLTLNRHCSVVVLTLLEGGLGGRGWGGSDLMNVDVFIVLTEHEHYLQSLFVVPPRPYIQEKHILELSCLCFNR